MISYIAVFVGGGIGAVLRYIISFLSARAFGTGFPVGTFVINILGSLFLGFIAALVAGKGDINRNLVAFLTIGIAGGFTTFSTFSYESLTLMRRGQVFDSMGYLFLSPVMGFMAVYLGSYLGKLYNG
jgi:fluoride exporter